MWYKRVTRFTRAVAREVMLIKCLIKILDIFLIKFCSKEILL